MLSAELPVGGRARREAGAAILAALGFVTLFGAFTWLSKETPAWNLRQPWREDPYDVIVSLDFAVLPLLVGAGALRVQLCRRYAPLPARRLVDLLRICGLAVAVCLVTEAGEWVAVGIAATRAPSRIAGDWQVLALAGVTAATLVLGWRLHDSGRAVRRVARAGAQPDWLADLLALGVHAGAALRLAPDDVRGAARWADARLVTQVRRRPVAAAAALATVLAIPFCVAKIVLEGYPPLLAFLSFVLPAGALFTFVVVAGRYLRVVAPRPGGPSAGVCALVGAGAGGTLLFAFHDALLGAHQTAAELNALFLGGAAGAGLAVLVGGRVLRSRRRTPARRSP